MSDPHTPLARVAAALAVRWLRTDHGVRLRLTPPEAVDPTLATLRGSVDGPAGPAPAVVAVVPLFDPTADAETLARKAAAEQRLAGRGAGGLALWVPPLAALPPPDAADDGGFTDRVLEAVAALPDGGRGEVRFPITLGLRRTGDDGHYISGVGGLQPLWARFTNQVFGEYALDSLALHRLPDDPAEATKLIDFIVLVANGLRSVGKTTTVKAEDTWVVDRLPELDGPTILTAAPSEEADAGTPVRKRLRAGMNRAIATLPPRSEAPARAIVFAGIYRSLSAENATVALRGMDPTVFAQFDLVALAADGAIKPLFGPRAGSPLSR